MLTKQEWLFIQLMSEANEVAHAASKIVQFGAHDNPPWGNYGDNVEAFEMELNDLAGTWQLIQKEKPDLLSVPLINPRRIAEKQAKLEVMYQYAKRKGIVE